MLYIYLAQVGAAPQSIRSLASHGEHVGTLVNGSQADRSMVEGKISPGPHADFQDSASGVG